MGKDTTDSEITRNLSIIGVIILIWYFVDFIFNKDGISTGNQCIVNLDEQNNSDIQINHMSNDVRNSMR